MSDIIKEAREIFDQAEKEEDILLRAKGFRDGFETLSEIFEDNNPSTKEKKLVENLNRSNINTFIRSLPKSGVPEEIWIEILFIFMQRPALNRIIEAFENPELYKIFCQFRDQHNLKEYIDLSKIKEYLD